MDSLPLQQPEIDYRSSWAVGVDIGQARDPTAVVIVERITGVHARANAPHYIGPIPRYRPVYRIRHMERLPLGTPYPTQVRAVIDRLERAPLDKLKPRILLDYTGVGRPVFDMFRQAGLLRGEAITITGGRETTETEFGFSVPKVTLVSRLQALLHSGDLRIPRALPDAAVLTRELQEFRVKYTDAGNATFNAREGEHDDLVLALAIAVFGLSESTCATAESLREYSHRQFFSR